MAHEMLGAETHQAYGVIRARVCPGSKKTEEDPATDALQRLLDAHPRKAEVMTLHVICGHPLPKVAEQSPRT